MKRKSRSSLTAVIQPSERYFVALCPELAVVSQGIHLEEALRNFAEADCITGF